MENYKIKVNNEAESKEARELFEKLGYEIECFIPAGFPRLVATTDYGEDYWYSTGYDITASLDDFKELTLPQLRDMVSAHRKPGQCLISGADAKLAWAKGENVQARPKTPSETWEDLSGRHSLDIFEQVISYEFRLKPRTITLSLEIPAPFEPKVGEVFFALYPTAVGGYSKMHITDQKRMDDYAKLGAWRTEEQVKQVVAALRGGIKA